MLKPCTIVLGMAQNCDQAEGDLIGADRGALVCARQQRRMVMAIGDFDSVNAEEMTTIRQYADQVEVLPVMKDETDALSALHWAKEQGYQPIILTGGLGGRQDHQLANLLIRKSRLSCVKKTMNCLAWNLDGMCLRPMPLGLFPFSRLSRR